MTREIKFRAWGSDGGMYYQDENTASAMHGLVGFAEKVGSAKAETPKVMQYTGLKDKNSKEIYEGDVCKVRSWLGNEIYGKDGKSYKYSADCWREYQGLFQVEYMDDCSRAGYDLYAPLEGEFLSLSDEGFGELQVEVIGNIYENPGLIK